MPRIPKDESSKSTRNLWSDNLDENLSGDIEEDVFRHIDSVVEDILQEEPFASHVHHSNRLREESYQDLRSLAARTSPILKVHRENSERLRRADRGATWRAVISFVLLLLLIISGGLLVTALYLYLGDWSEESRWTATDTRITVEMSVLPILSTLALVRIFRTQLKRKGEAKVYRRQRDEARAAYRIYLTNEVRYVLSTSLSRVIERSESIPLSISSELLVESRGLEVVNSSAIRRV